VRDNSHKRTGLLEGYLFEDELATELDKNLRTIQRWRKLRIGPPFVMNGVRPIYNTEQTRKWLADGGITGRKVVAKRNRKQTTITSKSSRTAAG
jgi:hypothetical protein